MAVAKKTAAKQKPAPAVKPKPPTRTTAAEEPRAERAEKAKAINEKIREGIKRAGVQGAAAATSRIVQKAAAILEEEIAAGIVAAKEFESKYVNIAELRQTRPEEVLHRFRADAHDVLDMFMDMTALATRSVGHLAQRVVSVGSVEGEADAAEESLGVGRTPTLSMPGALKPGETASVPMTLQNASDTATEEFSFYCSDLVSPSGARIPAHQILFAPSTVVIPPKDRMETVVTVVAPKGAAPGLYAGLLQSSRIDQLRAVLVVNVS